MKLIRLQGRINSKWPIENSTYFGYFLLFFFFSRFWWHFTEGSLKLVINSFIGGVIVKVLS